MVVHACSCIRIEIPLRISMENSFKYIAIRKLPTNHFCRVVTDSLGSVHKSLPSLENHEAVQLYAPHSKHLVYHVWFYAVHINTIFEKVGPKCV